MTSMHSDVLRPHVPRLRGARAVMALLLTLTTVLLLLATAARAAIPYQDPFGQLQPYVGRTDMGVDFCLNPGEPIRAIGNGVIVGLNRDWFENEPYLWYQLSDGADAGRYVYVAEQLHRLAHVGQTVHAGQIIARYAKSGTCIETGWGTSTGWTLAQSTTGYQEGEVTQAGISFAHFLISLGVAGSFELSPPPTASSSRARHHRRHHRSKRAAVS
jgi:hypothetical protein